MPGALLASLRPVASGIIADVTSEQRRGKVKFSNLSDANIPKLILSRQFRKVGQFIGDILTFTVTFIFSKGSIFFSTFLLQGLWGGAVLHQLWTHGWRSYWYSTLHQESPWMAGVDGECGPFFFRLVPIPLISVNHLND